MKILKKVLLVLVILIAVLAVIGWFMPSKIHIERSLTMKAPVESIFKQVNVVKNWEKWSPWRKMDPEMKVTYYDIAEGLGASYSWVGEKSGEGLITFSEVKNNELIITDLDFKGEGKATGGFRFEPAAEGTKVTWYFDSEVGMNPFMRLFWKMGIGMMEDSFDQGLKAMSDEADKMPAAPAFKMEVKVMPAVDYLFIHDTASVATIGAKLGAHYGALVGEITKQKLEQAGAPFAIYFTESSTNWEMDAGIPVAKAGKNAGVIQSKNYPGGNMLVVSYMGSYDGLPAGHEAARAYIQSNNLTIIGAPWEKYMTDPMSEKDSTKWLTEICYPVQ